VVGNIFESREMMAMDISDFNKELDAIQKKAIKYDDTQCSYLLAKIKNMPRVEIRKDGTRIFLYIQKDWKMGA
jgi:hypothetical protein